MPVKIVTGDLFNYPAPAIAHGCNCNGLFNDGVAGLVRRFRPEAAQAYDTLFATETFRPSLIGAIQPVPMPDGRYVVNLFTQIHGGPNARIDAIEDSIGRLVEWAEGERVTEVAIPMIGAGIGGLADVWAEVVNSIVEAVGDSLVTITIVRLP